MAEQSEYPLTHSPPENTELALLIDYIDQRVPEPELRHKDRMFTLLQANGLIARSNVEQQFLSRLLSIYAQQKADYGGFGPNHQIDTASLEIRCGVKHGKPYIGIVSTTASTVIIRGATRDTEAQAMECFIDTVLLLSADTKTKFEALRKADNSTG